MNAPKPVSGIEPIAVWMERMRQFVHSIRVLPGPGYRIRSYSTGIVLDLDRVGGAGTSPGGTIQQFQITALAAPYGDSFTARTSDGTTPGTTDFTIAKQYEERPSILTEVWDGVTITYTYSDNNHRIASDPVGGTQHEVCYPRYAVGKIIFCAQSKNGTGIDGVSWVDLTARVWQRMYVQTT